MNKYNMVPMNSIQGYNSVKPRGLYNSGVICYFNSVIQSLLSLPSFVIYLETDKANSNEILKYIKECPAYSKDSNLYDLTLFNVFLTKYRNKYKNSNFGNGQEDAGELLSHILDIIDDEYINSLFKHVYKCNLFCLSCRKSKEITSDTGFIFNVPYGAVQNNCIISKNATVLENDLTKYIRNNYSKCNGYKCDFCGSFEIIKTNRLLTLPTVIYISFNKFYNKYIQEFPNSLEFINSVTEKNKHIFSVLSTIHHNGTMSSGHYYSICNRGELWYELNDTIVTERSRDMSPEELASCYMVCYHYLTTI